ncbi:FkbM family methyltransferase [Actinobacillus genomosp. 2]|uniref:FkbM family methyltransferase n=1 Tax=Actinobacillus genomosp. 2 TaxID=230709 RepID=UPI00244208E4|nr:FkbM family methyltransferase [Actinobacillus genomosp. 2]WGE32343.1 FkbM family methyltransferase [Actinobacillus genomosp. 2]
MRTSLHQLKHGLFNLIEGDFISQYAKSYGEWSEAEVILFQKILNSPQHNVIEVGANIGMHAIPIAKMIPNGKLFCFEPQRIIFQTLCCNINLNSLTNVYCYPMGISHYAYQTQIQSSNYNTAWNYGSFSIDKGFSTEGDFTGNISQETISIIPIDQHNEIQQLDHLRLLKIDAEGFELNVLNGAKQTIEKHRPIIFIEAHLHSFEVLYDYLTAIDYDCYWFISNRYQTNNYFNAPETLSGFDFNFICFPNQQECILPEQFRVSKQEKENLPIIEWR